MDLRRVAVILEGRVQYERNVLLGIREFASSEQRWLIRLEMPGESVIADVREWEPDGILYQAAGLPEASIRGLEHGDVPAIHLSDGSDRDGVLHVGLNNQQIGMVAAEYFQKRDFSHYAFVGVKGVGFSKARAKSFVESLKESGRRVAVFEMEKGRTEKEMVHWLQDLPKPAALLATHDECALLVTTLCRGAGIEIPEELAILGVDNDELICELAWPSISSVAVPSRRVGFEAAKRLNHLMGAAGTVESVLLPPLGVLSRHSTDVSRTEDELVNRALRFMRRHLGQRINVDDVLRETGINRRSLERRFRAELGRSPLQELQRLRVERAEHLLIESDLPLHEVAAQCGWRDASHLVASFRRLRGETPGRFRDRVRGGAGGPA